MAGHLKCVLPVLSILLADVHLHEISTLLLDDLEPFPSVCGNTSEGLCTLLPARIVIGVGPKERNAKETKPNQSKAKKEN